MDASILILFLNFLVLRIKKYLRNNFTLLSVIVINARCWRADCVLIHECTARVNFKNVASARQHHMVIKDNSK